MKVEMLTAIEDEQLEAVSGGGIGRFLGGLLDRVLGTAGHVVGGGLSILGGLLSGIGGALRGHH